MALSCFSDTAKAVNVVAETDIGISRVLVVAITRPAPFGAEPPRAAAHHFGLTGVRAFGVRQLGFFVIIHLVKIVAPFPYVPANIKESPGIGQLLCDRAGTSAGVLVEPGIITQL